jgi:hypothetical protein
VTPFKTCVELYCSLGFAGVFVADSGSRDCDTCPYMRGLLRLSVRDIQYNVW